MYNYPCEKQVTVWVCKKKNLIGQNCGLVHMNIFQPVIWSVARLLQRKTSMEILENTLIIFNVSVLQG